MPTFSILLPSRDRLELLKLAIQSVLEQDLDDYEIIVSDNASSENYLEYITSLHEVRIKYLRSETALSVTDNWNKALDAAIGTYVLMLGDDDALAPGALAYLKYIIERYRAPQVIYVKAYHYLYPNAVPGNPRGGLFDVANSELFIRQGTPYWLEKTEAEHLARLAISFHHEISFNAQHFFWRQDFTQSVANFFRAPYPDYFACFYTFSKADTILVIPKASVIIGVAEKSFGFFLLNGRQEEGAKAFMNTEAGGAIRSNDKDIIAALNFPGSTHYRNWLLTSLRFQSEIEPSYEIDTELYRKIQIVESIAEMLLKDGAADLTKLRTGDEEWLQPESFITQIYKSMRRAARGNAATRISKINQEKASILISDLKVYYATQVRDMHLEDHTNIMHAFRHIDSTY